MVGKDGVRFKSGIVGTIPYLQLRGTKIIFISRYSFTPYTIPTHHNNFKVVARTMYNAQKIIIHVLPEGTVIIPYVLSN